MNDLLAVLLDMRNGDVARDCNEKFDEVVKAVLDTRGKGELTIKLFVSPSKVAIGGAVIEVETEHECKAKKPELKVGKAIFFVTADGRLTRDHPDQIALLPGDPQPQPERKATN